MIIKQIRIVFGKYYFFTSFMLNLKMEQPIDQFILSNMEGDYRMYLYFKYLFNVENRLTAWKVRSHRVSEWVYLKKSEADKNSFNTYFVSSMGWPENFFWNSCKKSSLEVTWFQLNSFQEVHLASLSNNQSKVLPKLILWNVIGSSSFR